MTIVQLFCEDRAHEEFIRAVVERLGEEEGVALIVSVAIARGGHGRVLDELNVQQRTQIALGPTPDILVVAIDANCKGQNEARREVEDRINANIFPNHVLAIPDPHIERWYLADPGALRRSLGAVVQRETRKCERDLYKRKLVESLRGAGHPVVFGGSEFAREIIGEMDFYRAARNESSLRRFLEALRSALRRVT